MRIEYEYQIGLHVAVVLFGTTGVLGKLISLDAYHLVWHRLIIAVVALGIFLIFTKHRIGTPRSNIYRMLGSESF